MKLGLGADGEEAMAPRPTRLIALFFLVGGLGCGINKPDGAGGLDPAGGAGAGEGSTNGAVTGGAGSSGAGGDPFSANGGRGIAGNAGVSSGGQPGAGQGGLGSGSGGATMDGSGGLPGSGGNGSANGSGGASGSGSANGSGSASGSGGTNGSGGANGSGGTNGSGGASGSGGTNGSGGVNGTGSGTGAAGGNVSGSGGNGAAATGGVGPSATGGAPATGGVSPAGSGGDGGGLTGGTGTGGATWVSGTCDLPYMIATDVSHVEVDVGTLAGVDTVDLPCATSAKVAVLSFDLMQTELVYADTFGASWDTVLAFADSCDGAFSTLPAAGTSACSDNACGTSQSQAVALLGYGQHFLYVGGAQGSRGVATVHFRHAPVGSGPLVMLPPGAGSTPGTTQGRGAVNMCQASGADNSYWWQSCPSYAGGAMSASTCTGTSFDTVLSLQIPGSGVASCADDDPSCGVQSKMSATIPSGAGIYVLTVDGTAGSDAGNYTLKYTRP